MLKQLHSKFFVHIVQLVRFQVYIQSIRIAVQIPPTIAAIYHDHKTSQL